MDKHEQRISDLTREQFGIDTNVLFFKDGMTFVLKSRQSANKLNDVFSKRFRTILDSSLSKYYLHVFGNPYR
jgi:hypothetical protein